MFASEQSSQYPSAGYAERIGFAKTRGCCTKLRRTMAERVEVTEISNDAWGRGEVGRGEVG